MNATEDETPEGSVDDENILGVAAWAYPAYEHAWYEYVAADAPYGRDYDGLMQWIGERVALQRAAYEASQRGPSFASWLLGQLATLVKRDRQHEQPHAAE